jgi:DNA adenine methylase
MDYIQSSMLEVISTKKGQHSVLADIRINSLLKWPGGKTGELNLILTTIPSTVARYFEPFLGGGAVFFSISDRIPAFVNDKSSDLMGFYQCIRNGEKAFFSSLEEMQATWQALERFVVENQDSIVDIYDRYEGGDSSRKRLKADISRLLQKQHRSLTSMLGDALDYDRKFFLSEIEKNLINKLIRTYDVEDEAGIFTTDEILQNIESSLKSGFYMYLRHLYNYHENYEIDPCHYSAIFFFIREYSYASMFRFNSQGNFNVPYGGITYNRKDFGSKIEAMKQSTLLRRLHNTVLENLDFLDFLRNHEPGCDDFIFIDPPYDTDFSNYDGNSFDKEDQLRLALYLINECRSKFMLVIKHTDYILSLYDHKGLNIRLFDKKYMWTIKDRNNRDAVHLMITNY